jgi:hypothetical protein
MHRPLVTLEVLAEGLECGPPFPSDSRDLMHILPAQLILIFLLGREVADQICQSQSPLAAVADVLQDLNTARKAFLASPGAVQDFRAIRATYIAGIREELAQHTPTLSI